MLTPSTSPTSSTRKQPLEIKLAGQKIVLKASHSDFDLIREVVELVSSKIKSAEKRSKSPAAHQIALMALLEVAEEYVKAKRRTLDFKREMNSRSESLMRILESELGA